MKVLIFNDKDNFDGCLRLINDNLFSDGQKRFWDYNKYLPAIFSKVKQLDERFKADSDFKLVNTIFYSGRYNAKVISNFKWSCHQKISETNSSLKNHKEFLQEIQKCNSPDVIRKVESKINDIIDNLEKQKQKYYDNIQKQKRNREGQIKFFEKLEKSPSIDLKTTILKQSNGEIYQKGVDVKLATDLIHLAHTDSYDIAIILGGDSDLKEAVKLVNENRSKIVIVVAYYTEGDPLLSNISDLKKEASYFLNLKEDFTTDELINMSSPLRERDS